MKLHVIADRKDATWITKRADVYSNICADSHHSNPLCKVTALDFVRQEAYDKANDKTIVPKLFIRL